MINRSWVFTCSILAFRERGEHDRRPAAQLQRHALERTYDAPAELIWELWTTAAGIEEWWAPDGFKNRVSKLELSPGGQLVYTMTATAPKQVEFLENAGLPLSTAASLPQAEESGHDARVAGAGVKQSRAPAKLPSGARRTGATHGDVAYPRPRFHTPSTPAPHSANTGTRPDKRVASLCRCKFARGSGSLG